MSMFCFLDAGTIIGHREAQTECHIQLASNNYSISPKKRAGEMRFN